MTENLTKSVENFILSNKIYGYEVLSICSVEESFQKDYLAIELTIKTDTSFNTVEHSVWINKKYLDEKLYKHFRNQQHKDKQWVSEIVPIEIGEFALESI